VAVGQVFASDPDSGAAGDVTYSLIAGSDVNTLDMFQINPETGEIRVTGQSLTESLVTFF